MHKGEIKRQEKTRSIEARIFKEKKIEIKIIPYCLLLQVYCIEG